MLFSFGFDSQVTMWNLLEKGGVVCSKKVEFEVEDCLWLRKKGETRRKRLVCCGDNGVHVLDLDPFAGKLDVRPFNLKKVRRRFLKLFQIEESSFVLCGTLSGDVLLLDLEFEKFLVKEVRPSSEVSKAKHLMTNTYPVQTDLPKVTHILSLSVPGKFLEGRSDSRLSDSSPYCPTRRRVPHPRKQTVDQRRRIP